MMSIIEVVEDGIQDIYVEARPLEQTRANDCASNGGSNVMHGT